MTAAMISLTILQSSPITKLDFYAQPSYSLEQNNSG